MVVTQVGLPPLSILALLSSAFGVLKYLFVIFAGCRAYRQGNKVKDAEDISPANQDELVTIKPEKPSSPNRLSSHPKTLVTTLVQLQQGTVLPLAQQAWSRRSPPRASSLRHRSPFRTLAPLNFEPSSPELEVVTEVFEVTEIINQASEEEEDKETAVAEPITEMHTVAIADFVSKEDENEEKDMAVVNEAITEAIAHHHISFKKNQAVLTPDSIATLKRVASVLAGFPGAIIGVEGHTSCKPLHPIGHSLLVVTRFRHDHVECHWIVCVCVCVCARISKPVHICPSKFCSWQVSAS